MGNRNDGSQLPEVVVAVTLQVPSKLDRAASEVLVNSTPTASKNARASALVNPLIVVSPGGYHVTVI
jgi:hypothetical protein